jgi:hypothetical protein
MSYHRNRPLSAEWLRQQKATGLSDERIALNTNCSVSTIFKLRRRYGIPGKPPGSDERRPGLDDLEGVDRYESPRAKLHLPYSTWRKIFEGGKNGLP